VPPGSQLVRVDGETAGGPIDWNRDTVINPAEYAQDLNYNGSSAEAAYSGYNDWENIDLRQVASRGNMLLLSSGIRAGDLAEADPLNGSLDLGSLDLGSLDLGSLDLGSLDLGSLDLGSLDLGSLDLGEIDFETATANVDPPTKLDFKVLSRSIKLEWKAPALGQILKYGVWRSPDTRGRKQFELIALVTGTPPETTFTDTDTRNHETYTYFVTTFDHSFNQSGPSNKVVAKQ
jgi:hypothetical protein